MNFVVSLTLFMTQKGNGVIRIRHDLLYDPKVQGDLCGRFDLVYDPKGHGVIRGRRDLFYDLKRSRGHKRSPWPTSWPQRSRWLLWFVWPILWPQNATGSLEVTVTYFMTSKVTVTFVVGLT